MGTLGDLPKTLLLTAQRKEKVATDPPPVTGDKDQV